MSQCYDFNGKIQGNLPFAQCTFSNEPPLSCNCGQQLPAQDLLVNGNVGTVSYVNGEITLLGRGGNFNTAIGPNLMDNVDNRNYTPYTVGVDGPALNSNDPAEYSSIQAAIDAAVAAGATPQAKQFVFIKPGTYNENLTLSSAVDLYTDSGSVVIIGSHTYNPLPGTALNLTRLTFRQQPGSVCLTITLSGTSPPPIIQRSTIVFSDCQIIQTDNTTVCVNCVIPGAADFLTFACLNSIIRGPNSFGTAPTFTTSGAGAVALNFFNGSYNGAWIDINSLGSSSGSFIFVGNLIRSTSANVSESKFTCSAPNTSGEFKSCYLTNDSSPQVISGGVLQVSAGVWQILGCVVQNVSTITIDYNLVGGNPTELWAIGNTFTDDQNLPIFILNNGAQLYAQNNLIFHNAVNWIDSTNLGGFYFMQYNGAAVGLQGSNTFRAGCSTTVGGLINIVNATTF